MSRITFARRGNNLSKCSALLRNRFRTTHQCFQSRQRYHVYEYCNNECICFHCHAVHFHFMPGTTEAPTTPRKCGTILVAKRDCMLCLSRIFARRSNVLEHCKQKRACNYHSTSHICRRNSQLMSLTKFQP